MSDSQHLSLKEHGLRAPDGLACPEGGNHDVTVQAVAIVANAGRGTVKCLKCGQSVRLERLAE